MLNINMYKITIKGEAYTDYPKLQELDGIECQDNFLDYFDRDDKIKEALDIERGAYMDFRYENNKLWTYTVYYSNRELTKEELKTLESYTSGQWSDGIGEGFEQFSCYSDDENEEVYISPWFREQIITTTQELIQNETN